MTTATRTDVNVIGPIDVIAEFAINQYTLTYTAGEHGSISGATEQTVNHGDSGTEVTAIPDEGYHFVGWSDGVATESRTDTGVTGDITVTALFEINTYTLTYNAGDHGSISGTTEQTVDHGSAGAEVTAVPDEGYHFVRWSDGNTNAARTDINVTGPIDVTAEFAINQYTLTIRYEMADGSAAPATYTTSVNFNEAYSVSSPDVPGYLPDKATVDGIMPAGDVDVTVTYTGIITEAEVSGIIAPSTGGFPITLESLTTGNASYSVTVLTWQNSNGTTVELTPDGRFKASSSYRAVIELTAATGFRFETLTPTVNAGTAESGSLGEEGKKLTFTITFAETQPLEVTAISVIGQPAKLAYTEREALDISGLAVTLTYNDGSTADIGYEQFDANNITVEPANGTIMTATDHNGQVITVTCNTHTAVTGPLTVNRRSLNILSASAAVNPGFDILFNGLAATAATASIDKQEDKTITTVVVDSEKTSSRLKKESENTVLTIPVVNGSDVVVAVLNGKTVKDLENKNAAIEIKTDNAAYILPAGQINIDAIQEQLGKHIKLKDIEVDIRISRPDDETVRIIENTAEKNNFGIVASPVEFNIICKSGSKTAEVFKFSVYVERLIEIPEDTDSSKITTGVILNPDGTFSHVPTAITVIDGKYYARINSLTNSTYLLIYSPKTFEDIEDHWAKEEIDDMASRLVINGINEDEFVPDKDITRAEFAQIVVKALGLMRPGTGKDVFSDAAQDKWYYDAVSIANEYGLITGYDDGEFRPDAAISREEAMVIISRAMQITGLASDVADDEITGMLEAFEDANKSADYAKESIAACIKNEIILGRRSNLLAPTENLTRAEVAVIARRLLQKSSLI